MALVSMADGNEDDQRIGCGISRSRGDRGSDGERVTKAALRFVLRSLYWASRSVPSFNRIAGASGGSRNEPQARLGPISPPTGTRGVRCTEGCGGAGMVVSEE